MRWVKFSTAGRSAYGILEGNEIVEVSGNPFDGFEKTARIHALDAVKIDMTPELRAEVAALSRTPPPATDRLEEIKPK